MLSVVALLAMASPQAVFRCPSAEAESQWAHRIVEEAEFDSICVDPKPGPKATALFKSKLGFVVPKTIDTPANLKWRNLTISFARGDISPAEWIAKTKPLKETIHFLSSPKTKPLRETMADVPVPPGGAYSSRAVFAELLALAWPGVPCLTSGDIGKTRELPDAGKHQSWILAMNDWLGPMLTLRQEYKAADNKAAQVLRADKQPGLLVFRITEGKQIWTFYLNNSRKTIKLPPLNLDKVSINRGLDLEGKEPALGETGFVIENP